MASRILLLIILLMGGGCALGGGTAEVPSAPPPAPEARDRGRAAALHLYGLRALRPPRGQAAD
ncbi:hypothetical protein J5Y09_22785, partial [Roseomonas sp. PWR1]